MDMIMIIVGGAVFAMVLGGVMTLATRGSSRGKDRTLAIIKGQSVTEGGEKNDKSVQDKRRAEIAKKLKETGEFAGKSRKSNLAVKIEQAGMSITVKQFWIRSLIFGVVITVIAAILGVKPGTLLLIFITGFLGLPRFFLKKKVERRQMKFLNEFSDALEAMVRLLKAGMPVTEAIHMASKEFEGPVGEEMSRIYDAQKIGISLPEAALMAARRMPITEMQMFATGVAIQAQTGSSLSEVLSNLAGVIRARFRLKRKVKALSAEAKASAMIIGSLPILIGTGLYLINPGYTGLLFTTPVGKALMVGSAVWMGIGIFMMKAMINFKV